MMNKVFSYLGLSQRAGKLVNGDEGVLKAVRSGEAKLVLMASDASELAKKKYSDKCGHYGVPMFEIGTRYEIGASLGKAERVIVAVTDQGLADLIRSRIVKTTEVEGID